MKTIFLFIRDPNLKMAVIRILMKDNFYYMEASGAPELSVKLDLARDVGLMIQDYKEGETEDDLSEILRTAALHCLPILWIMPAGKRDLLPDTVKRQIADLLLMPFDAPTLLRKINGILRMTEDADKIVRPVSISSALLSAHRDALIRDMESAAKGGYSICFLRLQIEDASMDINLWLLDNLKRILRETDRIYEMDLGGFLIVCPFTPATNLHVVASKIKDALFASDPEAFPPSRVQINGTGYPDDVRSYGELEARLLRRR